MKNEKKFAYILLAISIISEVAATALLKTANGFENITPMIFSLVGYGISIFFLGLSIKKIELSVAYAIWAGVGTVLTLAVSVILWGEVVSVMKVIAVMVIISGVVILNTSKEEKSESY